jgi:hypothetical protein
MNRNGDVTLVELDEVTAHLLTDLAESWGVSEGEAVRRAIAEADSGGSSLTRERWLEAFKELQCRLNLTPAKAAEWQDAIRDARR